MVGISNGRIDLNIFLFILTLRRPDSSDGLGPKMEMEIVYVKIPISNNLSQAF